MKGLNHSLLLLGLAGVLAMPATAKTVTPDEALGRVRTATNVSGKMKAARSQMKLVEQVRVDATAQPSVYVFTAERGNGYIVAPADDAFPAVLGYSDNGTFDPNDNNPGFRWLLDTYARNINAIVSGDVPASIGDVTDDTPAYSESWTPIEPLIKSKWDQSAPYNNLVPTITATGTARAYSGCVATALAQVMYYHKYPAVGTGTHSYTYTRTDGTTNTLSIDFSEYTFEWDKMLDTYTAGNYTDEQAEAVAKLMYACGVAVEASYVSGGTGAQTIKDINALTTYFGYSKSMRFTYRDYTDTEREFEEVVYKSLADKLPVIYSGASDAGGHSFVCDGYSTGGYFHINWGWSGSSDGYFLLFMLNPDDQGAGGSGAGYNDRQMVITGIRPAVEGETAEPQDPFLYYKGDFIFGTYEKPGKTTKENCFTVVNNGVCQGFYNVGPEIFNGYYGLLFEDAEGNQQWKMSTTLKNYKINYGTTWFSWTKFSDIDPGTYKVYPACQIVGKEPRKMACQNGFRDHIYVTVNDDHTFTAVNDMDENTFPATEMVASAFSHIGPVYANEVSDFTMAFHNVSEKQDYYGDIVLVVKNEAGEKVFTDNFKQNIPAGREVYMTAAFSFDLAPGNYTARFESRNGVPFTGEYPLVISEGASESFSEDIQFVSFSPTYLIPGETYRIAFSVKNVGTTAYAKPKYGIRLYKMDGSNVKSSTVSYSSTIGAGATKNYGVTNYKVADKDGNPLPAGDYYARVWWYKPQTEGDPVATKISQKIYITIGNPAESVTLDKSDIEVKVGNTAALTATMAPAEATGTVKWTSRNPEIASVAADGTVTGVAEGKTVVYAFAPNGRLAVCNVTVNKESGVNDIVAEGETVLRIVNVAGVTVAENPTEAVISNLPEGLYIFITDKGARKVVK